MFFRRAIAPLLPIVLALSVGAQDLDQQLRKAAQKGQAGRVETLLDSGANPLSTDVDGSTAFSLAEEKGRTQVLDVINAHLDQLSGALARAASSGTAEDAKSILAKGADVNRRNSEGLTALEVAAAEGHEDLVAVLLASGAEVAVAPDPAEAGRDNPFEAFLPAKRTKKDPKYSPALLAAAASGHVGVVDTLLKAGARIEGTDRDGNTALILAAKNGHRMTVRSLLEAGADTKAKNSFSETPLSAAASEGRTLVVQDFLESGETSTSDTELAGLS